MIAYTDGSCKINPGQGGFGVVILDDNENIITAYSKRKNRTTNNEMELAAMVWAAELAKLKNEKLTIYSDSAYAIGCLSKWMYSWEKNGWLKSNNQIPENLDLIKYFFNNFRNVDIDWVKVKGHCGNKYNEMADKLATGEYKNEK